MAERDVLILVVEEERQVREVLRQIFDTAGYKCLLTGDGEEGLKAFRESQPSLVVIDLRMPMVTGGEREADAGIQLLKQVRHVDRDAAVIVMSGIPDMKSVTASLKLGAYAFITKPIIIDPLLITVERALERRQLLIEHREHQQAHGQRQEPQRDVLIVEYEPVFRKLFHEAFVFCHYNCVLASDGREGLEMFEARRPPLVITELNMPAMSGGEKVRGAGIELLKQVRAIDGDAAVIVLDGMDVKAYIESLKLGAYAHLWKPVNLEELQITAERALELRQLLIERRQRQEGA